MKLFFSLCVVVTSFLSVAQQSHVTLNIADISDSLPDLPIDTNCVFTPFCAYLADYSKNKVSYIDKKDFFDVEGNVLYSSGNSYDEYYLTGNNSTLGSLFTRSRLTSTPLSSIPLLVLSVRKKASIMYFECSASSDSGTQRFFVDCIYEVDERGVVVNVLFVNNFCFLINRLGRDQFSCEEMIFPLTGLSYNDLTSFDFSDYRVSKQKLKTYKGLRKYVPNKSVLQVIELYNQ